MTRSLLRIITCGLVPWAVVEMGEESRYKDVYCVQAIETATMILLRRSDSTEATSRRFAASVDPTNGT